MSQRGRGNQQRGRSQSRQRGNTRNMFSRQTANDEISRQENERQNIRANETRAQQAPAPSQSTIAQTIDKGKKFISNFFTGFTSEKRANIQVELDNSFPTRIAAPYADAIQEHIYSEYKLEPDSEKGKSYFSQFVGISHISTALKLHKSSPMNEKTANSVISSLNSELRLPNKMGTLIDQVGKTDLPNDNRIRIDAQHLSVKQHLIRGMYYYLGEKLKDHIPSNSEGHFNFIETIVTDMDKMKCLIDNKPISTEYLKLYGKRRFEKVAQQNFKFTISEEDYEFRIPFFDFSTENTPTTIKKYLSNKVFVDFAWTGKELNLILGSLVLQVAKPNWLRNSAKKMKELDKEFANTPIAELSFAEIMMAANIYNINWIFSDEDINNITMDIIHNWNSQQAPHLSKIINFTDFKFSEYGTDAQLVQLEEDGTDKPNQFDIPTYRFEKKNKASTSLKPTEHGAIMGIMGGFSSQIEIENNININFNSNNNSILNEYIRSDFIMKL
jgi:hypothetical protein